MELINAAFLGFILYLVFGVEGSTVAMISPFFAKDNMRKTFINLLRLINSSKIIYQIIQFIGLFVFGVGFCAVIGYYTANETYYKWVDGSPGMALSTAVLFLAIAATLLLIMRYIKNMENKIESRLDELEKSHR